MTDRIHIKGSLEKVGVPIAFDACIQMAAGDCDIEKVICDVTVTFDRRCAPAAYARFLEEDGAETWCAEQATRLALDSYLTGLRRTAGLFAPRPRN